LDGVHDLPAARVRDRGWVGAGIGISTYLLFGAIWIVVTTVIVVSVRDVRDFRLRPSLQEPDLAASVPAS
jgi:hypothetical protein